MATTESRNCRAEPFHRPYHEWKGLHIGSNPDKLRAALGTNWESIHNLDIKPAPPGGSRGHDFNRILSVENKVSLTEVIRYYNTNGLP